jgi:hypothetical protein
VRHRGLVHVLAAVLLTCGPHLGLGADRPARPANPYPSSYGYGSVYGQPPPPPAGSPADLLARAQSAAQFTASDTKQREARALYMELLT